MINRKNFVRLSEWLVGLVFIFSAFGKIDNASGFGELITSYGLAWFSILSPVIIIMEMAVGLCFVLHVKPRSTAIVSILMLSVFSLAFMYANIIHGIDDCGCFGSIETRMPVWAIYVRNLVLLLLSVFIWLYEPKVADRKKPSVWLMSAFAGMMAVTIFFTGNSWRMSTFYTNQFLPKHPLIDLVVAETPLNDYLQVSADSTYIVWVFSYSCSTCINSMENIKHYQEGLADRFVPMSVTEDESGRKRKLLNVDFNPINVGNGLSGFIEVLPTLLYIEKGVIKYVIEGGVPNVYLFKSNYLEMSNDEILNNQ